METDTNKILLMSGIEKTFPGVKALSNVDFSLNRGEIHALVGENGAGKSTLIKVLTGVERPSAGQIVLDGSPVSVKSPLHAQELGISTVYQEINLCPNLSVSENIFIGMEPKKNGRIDWKEMNRRAQEILARMSIYLDVKQILEDFPVAIQQMVAIARSLQISSKILILDEPTSSLDINETEKLFQVMRQLKQEGMAIIFVTHFLDQVYEVSDRITVLRNGKLVGTYETASLSRFELVSKMIGRELQELNNVSKSRRQVEQKTERKSLLKAKGVGLRGSIQPFDLDINAGEVVGLAGLLGSGRTEIANLFFGVDKPDSGQLSFAGQEIEHFSPLDSIHRGIAFCPEDRKADGIVPDLTIRENIVLALQASRGWLKYLPLKEQYELADKYIELLNISTPNADQLIKNLSGGNQQKVILARWLVTDPDLLILDEPTRGIDIGAKAEIQQLVLDLATEGKSCLFISSELEEVLRTSHRVAVLHDRRKVAEFAGDAIDETRIMQAMAGVENE